MALETTTAAEARAAAIIRPVSASSAAPSAPVSGGHDKVGAGAGLFETVVDAINPLQHLPVVGTVYRAASDDGISPVARMAGGWLFGGPIGLGISTASSFIEMLTGQDPAEMAVDMAMDWFGDDAADARLAENQASPNDAPPSDGPLLGKAKKLAAYNAEALARADGARRPGYGAREDVVGWSSNIWTQRALTEAMAEVTGKYDAANSLSKNKDGSQNERLERVL